MKKPISLRHFWVAGLICLFFASYQAWKDEYAHVEELLKENRGVANEREFWKDQSYQKDSSLRDRDQLLGENFRTLNGTQQSLVDLSRRVLDIAKPEPLKITMGLGSSVFPKPREGYKGNEFFVFTNKVIPGRGQFSCDQDMVDIHVFVVGNANIFIGGSRETGGAFPMSPRMIQVNIATPLMTPTSPLIVTFNTKDAVRWCRFNPM